MINLGDKQTPVHGLYDDSDGYDAPEGTASIMVNLVPNRNKSSLISRGGFVKDIDLPSTSNGGITAATGEAVKA